jgi:Uma2 family endonuclease
MSTRLPTTSRSRIPPLENGDRLTRDEFERRYRAMPAHVKAELIEGVVFTASPARYESHGQPDSRLVAWLAVYQASTPGTDCVVNGTVRLGEEDEPQPDSFLLILPEFGGQARITEDDYIEGAPDLVVEIAASSVSVDLGPKKRAYAKNGVREYLVWRTLDEAIDWFVLRDGTYVSLTPDAGGVLRSDVFPGLWLDVAAALDRNTARILAVLQQGVQSPDHARFVADLESRRST